MEVRLGATTAIQLGHHLVPNVLARLGKLASLPDKGVLAGQSVASALMEELGLGQGVYNDIDIFLPADEEREKHLGSLDHLESESLRLGIPVASLDEYRALGMCGGSDLHILGATEEGLLNYVWCKTDSVALNPTRVVYSFDLNCVEAAIDLQSKKLYWSSAFEHFLRTRELEVTSVATPARTMLRYLKKRDELRAFGKDEFVAHMLAGWLDWTSGGKAAEVLLSRKYADLAQRYAGALEGVFTLVPSPAKLELAADWTYPEGMEDVLAQANTDISETDGLVRLVPAMMYGSALRQPAEAEKALEEARKLCELEGEDSSFAPEHGQGDAVQMSLWLLGWRYISGQRSKTHFEVVRKTVERHPELCSALVGLTLDEQYQCVLDLKRRAKKEGDHIYGIVETSALPADMWNQAHRDAFFERVEQEETKTLLRDPFFSEMQQDGWHVQELLTVRTLRVEGSQMEHCVGGYNAAVQSGRSRILSIRQGSDKTRWSTAELRLKDSSKTFVVQQHYGRKNTPVHPDNAEVLARYLEQEGERTGWKKEDRKGGSLFDFDMDF